jgi:tetratricopeptide (TPR) repeat protein
MDAVARQLAKAQQALDAGRVDHALAVGRDLVRKHPQAGSPLLFLGQLYCRGGKPSAGLPFLRRAANAAPLDARIRRALAHCLGELGLIEEAVATAAEALALESESTAICVEGNLLLGNLFCRAGRFAEAETSLRQVVETMSAQGNGENCRLRAAAHNDLANVLIELGRPAEAIANYREAINCEPHFVDAWANLAAALLRTDFVDEAAHAARRAVALAPRHTAALMTLGSALSEQGRWAEARGAFDTLLAIEPLSHAARYNRSLACLALGEWSAWEDFRLRHIVEPTVTVASGLPRWSGESLSGMSILVRREQGIGTQIMFSGYLPALANVAGKVVVECERRMKTLLARTLPGIEFCDRQELFRVAAETSDASTVEWLKPRPDVETAIGDLPALMRRADTVGEWSQGIASPRLTCDAELIRKWQGRLSRLGGGLCVGVSWRGGGTTASRRKRSTTLDQWSAVFGVPGARFVSLQYGDCDVELAEHADQGGAALHRWSDFNPRDDLEDLAALSAALDLVISVDNSTAHLAGAVGVPLWLLLPRAADWRWLIGRNNSAWYPSAELLREGASGWPALLNAVAEKLKRRVAEHNLSAARVG